MLPPHKLMMSQSVSVRESRRQARALSFANFPPLDGPCSQGYLLLLTSGHCGKQLTTRPIAKNTLKVALYIVWTSRGYLIFYPNRSPFPLCLCGFIARLLTVRGDRSASIRWPSMAEGIFYSYLQVASHSHGIDVDLFYRTSSLFGFDGRVEGSTRRAVQETYITHSPSFGLPNPSYRKPDSRNQISQKKYIGDIFIERALLPAFFPESV